MEVMVPVQDSHFESATTTPYITAPSSPKHFVPNPLDFYYPYAATPTSPAPAAADDDFAFDFSGQLENNAQPPALTSADELFHQGKIRTLRPASPVSAFSPKISLSENPKESKSVSPVSSHTAPIAAISCSSKWRIKDFLLFRECRATGDTSHDFVRKFPALPFSSSSLPKVKREGGGNVSRSSSFRSVDSNESMRRGSARRSVSPHVRHYAAKKAEVEEIKKKKTALGYRQSFFSCLRFSPSLHGLTSRGW